MHACRLKIEWHRIDNEEETERINVLSAASRHSCALEEMREDFCDRVYVNADEPFNSPLRHNLSMFGSFEYLEFLHF